VFSKDHVFTIKEDRQGVFEVWGNEFDRYTPIIGYLRLSKRL